MSQKKAPKEMIEICPAQAAAILGNRGFKFTKENVEELSRIMSSSNWAEEETPTYFPGQGVYLKASFEEAQIVLLNSSNGKVMDIPYDTIIGISESEGDHMAITYMKGILWTVLAEPFDNDTPQSFNDMMQPLFNWLTKAMKEEADEA